MKKPVLIGFAGKARHGKTTAANIVKKLYEKEGKKVIISPCANVLKQTAMKIGWNGEKDAKGRTLLQELSTPIKNYFGQDYYAKEAIKFAVNENPDVILVDDVRMFPEVNYFKSLAEGQISKCILIRINRPEFVSDLSKEQLMDKSEIELDHYFDEEDIIINDGSLEDLEEKLKEKLKGE